eukprot:481881-Amphidinium_carterae.1
MELIPGTFIDTSSPPLPWATLKPASCHDTTHHGNIPKQEERERPKNFRISNHGVTLGSRPHVATGLVLLYGKAETLQLIIEHLSTSSPKS